MTTTLMVGCRDSSLPCMHLVMVVGQTVLRVSRGWGCWIVFLRESLLGKQSLSILVVGYAVEIGSWIH